MLASLLRSHPRSDNGIGPKFAALTIKDLVLNVQYFEQSETG